MGLKTKRPKEEIAEDWCFVCKEGGQLLICDYGDCLKVYHPKCVGKDDSILESDKRWSCDWHVCRTCKKSSKFKCYCCPKSWCTRCSEAAEFILVKGKKGFCSHCLRFVALVEQKRNVDSDGEKVDFNNRETVEFFFMDYWVLINQKIGLTSETIQHAYTAYKKGKNSIVDAEHDDGSESEDETMVSDFEDISDEEEEKRKVKRRRHSIKKKVHKVPRNIDGGLKVQQTCFVSMVQQNMRHVYLRRSLVQLLSKHPHTFEGKVVGSFVRVELNPLENLQRRYLLSQVTGITNDVDPGRIGTTLLQVSYGANDIPISMLSDDDFTEEECEELRHNIKERLHNNITRAEFEQKVRNLHADITQHMIMRELAVVQDWIDQASVDGWRRKCYEYTEKMQVLRNPTKQTWLLHEAPAVCEHPPETKPTPEDCKHYCEEIRKTVSPESTLKDISEIYMKSYESSGTRCMKVKTETEDASEQLHLQKTRKTEHEVKHASKYIKEEPARAINEEYVEELPQQLSNGTLESQSTNAKQSSLKDEPAPVPVKVIDLSDDEEEESDGKAEKKQIAEDLESCIWHCKSPHGMQKGPFSLSLLKSWSHTSRYSLNYKVWKTGQSEAESISLADAVRFL